MSSPLAITRTQHTQTRYIRPQLVACRLTNGDLQNSAKKLIFARKCVQNQKIPAKSLRKMLDLAGGHVIA